MLARRKERAMICYKDKTFCSRDCANMKCSINKKNINKPKDLEWMPIAYSDFKDCDRYKAERREPWAT